MVVLLEEKPMHDSSEPGVMQMSPYGTQQKLKSIEEACERLDFEAIVELATSTGGLLTDELRRKACAYLVLFICGTSLTVEKGRYYWAAWTGIATKISCREHLARLGSIYPGIPTRIKSSSTLIEHLSTIREVRSVYPPDCTTG